MDKIRKIDRSNADGLGTQVVEQLSGWAEERGLVAEIKGGTIRAPHGVTFRLEVCVKNVDGTVIDSAAQDFQERAAEYGLKPEDLGREFVWKGERFKISGLKLRSTKFPILALRIGTRRTFKFKPEAVKRLLEASDRPPLREVKRPR